MQNITSCAFIVASS